MAIFFIVIGHNECFRVLKHDFQHSSQTIHNCFREVLNGMMEFAKEIIVPTSFDLNPDVPGNHKALRRIFQGAVGALDGALVHAPIPNDQQTCYRGRGRDKSYLCDVAYTNTRGFMTPFRNTRYWASDFNGRRPLTRQEKFNHAHARLRNVIERAYGVLKSRFPILKQMAPYPFSVQRDIVIACFAVHNFIRMEKIDDTLFAEYDNAASSDDEEEENRNECQLNREQHYRQQWGTQGVQYMNNLRDQNANQLERT
ncbi:uncharacterized protein LOC141665545 [Apium graveolens]|uniref:uncharacterized protein LOC141665545 n=1 Tax=Apium graveolens TaxID=4045 RepID=UPI003D7AEDC3